MKRNIIYLFVLMMILPMYAGKQELKPYRKMLELIGMESVEQHKALQTLGLTANESDAFYDDIAEMMKPGFDMSGISPEILLAVLPKMASGKSLFTVFEREQVWTITPGSMTTVEQQKDAIELIGDEDMNKMMSMWMPMVTAIKTLKMIKLENRLGDDLSQGRSLRPSKVYREKLDKLLTLNGDKEQLRRQMKIASTAINPAYGSKVDEYFDSDMFIMKVAYVYKDFFDEAEIDELCRIYSSREGARLLYYHSRMIPKETDDINSVMTSSISRLMETQKPDDTITFQTLCSPLMRKFEASYCPLSIKVNAFIGSSVEECLGLEKGILLQQRQKLMKMIDL